MNCKKLLSCALSVALAFAMASGAILPGAVAPISTKAAQSVYDFDYGSGITWPEGEQLPTFRAPAPTTSDPMDAFLIMGNNNTLPIKYMMASLQGLVNRDRPRILLLRSADEGNTTWADEIFGKGYYKTTSNYRNLLTKYKSYVKGLVVYDPEIPASMNVATSIAGVEDCIISSPDNITMLQQQLGVRTLVDLRGKFTDMIGAYNYLYDNYYKNGKLNKRVLLGLNPEDHTPTTRDFAVATKSAVLWLDPTQADQKAVLDKFYSEATPGVTYHLGWWTAEDTGVTYGTRMGVSSIPADWFDNYTAYAGQSRQLEIPETPAKPTLKNKIYLSFAVSDGDNTQYVEHFMKKLWRQNKNDAVPVSWTCSPAMYYFAPQMLNSYYKTLGNDMLICGPSGFGYTKTTRWREKEGFLDKYIQATDDVFARTGFNIITLWDRISEGAYSEFAGKSKSVLGLTINNNSFNDADSSNADSMYRNRRYQYFPQNTQYSYGAQNAYNIPILGLGSYEYGYVENDTNGRNWEQKVTETLSGVADNFDGSAPVFRVMQIVSWSFNMPTVTRIAQKLNQTYPGKFEFVRADHLFMLMNEYNNKPYNVALQKEATASYTDLNSTAHAGADGSLTTAWTSDRDGENWYQLDLGSDYTISRFTLKNAGLNNMDKSLNTKAFRFQTSLDGKEWSTASTVTDNTEDIIYKDITAAKARYVRVVIDDPGADGVARIQDLEVYGNVVTASEAELSDQIAKAKARTQGTISDYNWQKFQAAITDAQRALDAKNTSKYAELSSALRLAELLLLPENDVAATALNLPQTLTLNVGGVQTFENVVTPANTSDKLTWSSSNEDVLSVQNGVLYAKQAGVSTVTLTTERGLSTTMKVTVKVPVTALTLDKTTLTMTAGDLAYLQATVSPSDATDGAVLFTSSDPAVVQVSEYGELTALKAGTAVITARANDNAAITATCRVTVKPSAASQAATVKSLKFSKKTLTLKAGKSKTMKAKLTLAGSGSVKVTYKSSNKSVVKVTSTGKLKAVAGGVATVTAKAGGKTAKLKVRVNGLSKGNKAYYKAGKRLKKRWVKVGKRWYYADKKGKIVKGKSLKIGKKTFKFNKKGVCLNH